MNNWIYIGIGVIILIYIIKRYLKSRLGLPVLKAIIGTNDGKTYNVEFIKLSPETTEIENVRMVLNFFAKMIQIISKNNEYERVLIFEFLNEVVNKEMNSAEIIDFIEIPVTTIKNKSSKKNIEATLYYKNVNFRNILTKVPMTHYEYQYANSSFALLKHTLSTVKGIPEKHLINSLKIMRDSYLEVTNLDDAKVMVILPNQVFYKSLTDFDN